MVVISYAGKEANAKIVYYGPGLGGKTSNLEFIYDSVPSSSRGKMVSMKTQTDRTLFFDFLPLDLGELGGFRTRFLLYTVPGQVFYNATRKLVLRGADAIAFVADSQVGKMDENKESLANLEENLVEYDLSLDTIPWVIQYNKRDLPEIYSIEELNKELNARNVPYFEGIATEGVGVFETFRGLSKLLLEKLSEEIGQRLVTAKHVGPKTEDQRAKAVERILMGPLTERAGIPIVGAQATPAESPQDAQSPEAALDAETRVPMESAMATEPQPVVEVTAGPQTEEQPVGEYVEDGTIWETEPEPEDVALEELDLVPEAACEPLLEAEEPIALIDSQETTPAEPPLSHPEPSNFELMREHEARPNFFAGPSASARLELERDTAHFAEAHDHARERQESRAPAAPEATAQPVTKHEPAARQEPLLKHEPATRHEPMIRPEPVVVLEQTRAPEPVTQVAEEPVEVEEEISFLNIIRRNNVGVFEKTALRSETPSQKPAPAPEMTALEVPVEHRGIESNIEIPLPLRQGEKMQEVTLTIRIRLKPVIQQSGAADNEFILEGISR